MDEDYAVSERSSIITVSTVNCNIQLKEPDLFQKYPIYSAFHVMRDSKSVMHASKSAGGANLSTPEAYVGVFTT